MFSEFKDLSPQKFEDEDEHNFSGDVKYHLGASSTRKYNNGDSVHITLLPNPSHLETVNTVAMGKARSVMDKLQDKKGDHVITCTLHGDAAFAGQGIVYEMIQMEQLKGYHVGGCIHVITNNQVGFTTMTFDARSSRYCSDIAKTINGFVMHVNADDPEYVDWAFELAVEYRNKFKRDVFIDIIGYRKYGHNEQDQPLFTQPLMYKKIKPMTPMWKKYCDKLIGQGVITQDYVDGRIAHFTKIMQTALDNISAGKMPKENEQAWDDSIWEKFTHHPSKMGPLRETAVTNEILKEINNKINLLPEGYKFHPNLVKNYAVRHQTFESGTGISWDAAEAMAFATLVNDGFNIRLSGEDVERATFAHRHCILHDQNSDENYCPIRQVVGDKDGNPNLRFQVYNSLLSEYGVLGYDYGYSIGDPNCLTIWEAQFGDFANVAQPVIDLMISSGERKWGVKTGLVLLLPHGMDGMGPEHSSARLERFLTLMDDDPHDIESKQAKGRNIMWKANMQIVNVTNPANLFHVLRRQLFREFRKPLIVMSPKKIFRHKMVKSDISEFSTGRFNRVYGELKTTGMAQNY